MSSGRPFQGSLFAEDFLRDSIRELPDWSTIPEAEIDQLEADLRRVIANFPTDRYRSLDLCLAWLSALAASKPDADINLIPLCGIMQ